MSVKKIIAIALIFVTTSIAWMILGATNYSRTDTSFSSLKSQVANLYGQRLTIIAPVCYTKIKRHREETVNNVRRIVEYYERQHHELIKSDIRINVYLDRRKKGNLWFPTFRARFEGKYTFLVDAASNDNVFLLSTLDSANSIYNNLHLNINGKDIDNILPLIKRQEIPVVPLDDNTIRLHISYEVTGMEEIRYLITPGRGAITQINDFNLVISTDFDLYDFPSGMMSPTYKIKTDKGYDLIWSFNRTITGRNIGLIIPNKLNPGEIITRVSFFAPVSLLFFFVVLLMFSVVLNINLHPMHFFFLAATFFSFHLMFSYFSDQMNIYLSFAISAVVSLILTITYMRFISPKKVAFVYAPIIQFIYLIVFSFSFFFAGTTGVIVTICAVVTLFILMQATGKINWDDKFK
ncbi:MAG: inner membrane CreD family protein [Spirochaetes bacterium]|nr:inner membrane CreD family protein [Spirochaetota bacterium]